MPGNSEDLFHAITTKYGASDKEVRQGLIKFFQHYIMVEKQGEMTYPPVTDGVEDSNRAIRARTHGVMQDIATIVESLNEISADSVYSCFENVIKIITEEYKRLSSDVAENMAEELEIPLDTFNIPEAAAPAGPDLLHAAHLLAVQEYLAQQAQAQQAQAQQIVPIQAQTQQPEIKQELVPPAQAASAAASAQVQVKQEEIASPVPIAQDPQANSPAKKPKKERD